MVLLISVLRVVLINIEIMNTKKFTPQKKIFHIWEYQYTDRYNNTWNTS